MKGDLFNIMKKRTRTIQSVKGEIRILAIKDVPLNDPLRPLWVIGVIFRGGYWLDGMMRTQIPAEELDATPSLIEMIRSSPHYDQIRVIMLDNIVLGRRKIVDIDELYEKTGKPVILLMDRTPSTRDLLERQYETAENDLATRVFEKIGKGVELNLEEGGQKFMWSVGLSNHVAERIVERTTREEDTPEALRVAKLVSSAFLYMLLDSKV